jgi:hypothetical protein
MTRLAVLLAATACGSAAHPARPPSRTPYLMLFESGKTFILPALQATSAGGAPVHGTATCRVGEVKQVGNSSVSRLACAAPYQSLLISGTWVAAPEGLYHPYLPVDEPDELALLGEDDLLIAAIPKERDHSHVVDQTQETIEAFEHAGSWCVRHNTRAGDSGRGFALCFGSSTITGAWDLVYAGSDWQRVDLGDVPADDEATND